MASHLPALDRIAVGDVEFEYAIHGDGPPVVLIHSSHLPDGFAPVVPDLRGLRSIRYRRRGFADGPPAAPGLSVAAQADDVAAVLDALREPTAHVVGHSYGGVIALEFAARYPGRARSLALLEPALVLQVPSAPAFVEALGPVLGAWEAGEHDEAVAGFLGAVGGPDVRAILERAMPGSWDQALADGPTFFDVELPALQAWELPRAVLGGLRVPVLHVRGDETLPFFVDVEKLVAEILPQAQLRTVPRAGHLLQVQRPRAVADVVGSFLHTHSDSTDGDRHG